jgi:hypothetical protein
MKDTASRPQRCGHAQLCYLGFYSSYLSFSTGSVREIRHPPPASGPSISSISASISMAPASAPASGPASQASQSASASIWPAHPCAARFGHLSHPLGRPSICFGRDQHLKYRSKHLGQHLKHLRQHLPASASICQHCGVGAGSLAALRLYPLYWGVRLWRARPQAVLFELLSVLFIACGHLTRH